MIPRYLSKQEPGTISIRIPAKTSPFSAYSVRNTSVMDYSCFLKREEETVLHTALCRPIQKYFGDKKIHFYSLIPLVLLVWSNKKCDTNKILIDKFWIDKFWIDKFWIDTSQRPIVLLFGTENRCVCIWKKCFEHGIRI